MTNHNTGTREEWLAARLELLKAEKEPTRRSDAPARRREDLRLRGEIPGKRFLGVSALLFAAGAAVTIRLVRVHVGDAYI
jgi:hypothetical protein